MRQIILDTETTGLEWKKGNRVVEIGCVELLERRPSGRNFHRYLKPDCDFEPGAQDGVTQILDPGDREICPDYALSFPLPDHGGHSRSGALLPQTVAMSGASTDFMPTTW